MKINHFLNGSLIVVMIGIAMQSLQAAENKTIVVYGASGKIGEVVVDEALARGHKVTGISRNPEKLKVDHENFTSAKGDLTDVDSIRELARDADAIVISVVSRTKDNIPENSLVARAASTVEEALSGMEDIPYIVQIGSASLMYGSTLEEITENMKDAPFPFEEGTTMYGVIIGHQISLDSYRASSLPWTIVAPPMKIMGIYPAEGLDSVTTRETWRTSTTGPVIDAEGNKTIYVRDLAKAAIDEIENEKFVGQVFTVGY